MILTRSILPLVMTFFLQGQPANDPHSELREHIGWSIAHEGCPVYGRTANSNRADTILSADNLRQCFLTVQQHNPVAFELIQKAPDAELIQITKEAVEQDKIKYQIRENLEWVLSHEGQLPYFRTLAKNNNFSAIRSRYRQLQSHNPNAINVLNALSDSELDNALNEDRVSIGISIPPPPAAGPLSTIPTVALEVLSVIERFTQPTTTTLAKDITLGDLTNKVYGTRNFSYVEAIATSNAQLLPPTENGVNSISPDTSTVFKAGTTVVIPSLPVPGSVQPLPLKPGVSPADASAAINAATRFVRSEVAKTGQIEVPVTSASLQSATINTFADQGTQWYLSAIWANNFKRSDLVFYSPPVVTVVGVVDGGVDANHPLIKPVLWPLPEDLATPEWPSGSIGYDFYEDGPNPIEELDDSHGTHVTGLVTGRQLATWLPVFDEAGLSNNVEVFSLKVAGGDGTFDFTAAQNAIETGIASGIHIFNLSLFGPFSQMLQQDLSRLERINSTLFIVASGNDGQDLDTTPSIQRSFRAADGKGLSNVIFVAALADTGQLADFSNYGKTLVQIAAPGVEISSTIHSSGFGTLSGTSQAAPFVTLAAAILKAEKTDMVPIGIKNRILNTCDWDDSLKDKVASGCKLNLLKAVISGSDLVELKSGGRILRGDIDRQQFFSSGPADLSLVRVWIPSPSTSSYIYASGKHEPQSMMNRPIAIKLHAGEVCPNPLANGVCTLGASDVKDIVFRVR
jgi:Subtilase family